MNNEKKVNICFIKSFPSIKEGIFYLVPELSNSKLKSFKFKKKFLEKEVRIYDEISFPLDLINHNKINPLYTGRVNEVIAENDNLIILSKAANVHSHPLDYNCSNNLLSWIVSTRYQSFLDVNKNSYDRGLIYRLDYETSGLIYYAKNNQTYQLLRDNFSTCVKSKTYLCLVQGRPRTTFDFSHYLSSSHSKGNLVSASNTGEFNANLSGQVLSYNEELNLSLLKIQLNQGRRHQIRVQLATEGFPILGDTKYGAKGAERLFLHCYRYSLELNQRTFTYKSSEFDLLDKYFPEYKNLIFD